MPFQKYTPQSVNKNDIKNHEPFGYVCTSPTDLEPVETFTRSKKESQFYEKARWNVEPVFDGFQVARHSKRLIEHLREEIKSLEERFEAVCMRRDYFKDECEVLVTHSKRLPEILVENSELKSQLVVAKDLLRKGRSACFNDEYRAMIANFLDSDVRECPSPPDFKGAFFEGLAAAKEQEGS